MNYDRIEVITVLSTNWKAQMYLDAMAAQGRLMNGQKQFSKSALHDVETALIGCVMSQQISGNYPLEALFENALRMVRRLY